MEQRLLELALRILRDTSREKPADAVLRDVLKRHGRLAPAESREVVQAVFAYYRWLGWLEQSEPAIPELRRALELAQRYQKSPASFPEEELIERAVPAWVRQEVEVTYAWVASLQRPPRLWLRARQGTSAEVIASLRDCRPFDKVRMPDALEYLGREDLFKSRKFQEGAFEIQDIASQAVSFACAPVAGEKWWDACAGRGGKTLHLSDLTCNKGLILATDAAQWRLRQLKLRAARAGAYNYQAKVWNGGIKLPSKMKFDGVLVDAPCSSLGTWQRNPHDRWTATLQDIRELAALQKQILSNVAGAVKPGGKVFYSVCTLTRSETNEVADAFEKSHPRLERLALHNPLDGELYPEGKMALWPQSTGGNGMFVAAWKLRE